MLGVDSRRKSNNSTIITKHGKTHAYIKKRERKRQFAKGNYLLTQTFWTFCYYHLLDLINRRKKRNGETERFAINHKESEMTDGMWVCMRYVRSGCDVWGQRIWRGCMRVHGRGAPRKERMGMREERGGMRDEG